MPTFNGRNYTGVPGLNIREANGTIRFETPLSTPVTTSGERVLYVDSSNNLKYNNGSSVITLSGGGGSGVPSWETMFAADATFTVTPDTAFTVAGNRSTATNVVSMTNTAGASGAILAFTNATTSNNDVLGTGSTWAVTGAGNATFVGLTITGTTITSTTGAKAWTLLDNSATALVIGASGAASMMTFDTTNGTEVVKLGNNLSMTDGNATFISSSNTVTNVLVTNNSITTFGANASSAGAVCIRSTSLTTGSLLQLQLSDTANVGGFYLTCRESVGGSNDFTIGENGVIAMAGTASSDSLLISLGNITLSSGSVAVTTAANSVSMTVTNNSATSASVVVLAGSGVFTGVTTASWMTLTPSGLTTGTALYLVAVGATTSVAVVDIAVAGLTSGSALRITSGTAAFTTGGKLIELSSTAAVAGNLLTATTTGAYTGTGMILVTAGAATTGILLSLVSTTGMTSGSLIRATTSTAGAIATSGAISFSATGIYTSTSNCGFVNITANATTAGTVLAVNATGLVDGIGIYMPSAEAGLTTGNYMNLGAKFTVSKYGATVIAGNASGTAALTLTAGDAVITSGFLVISANAKGITFTGIGANGGVLKNLKNAAASALSGTQLDVAIDIGGTPYYFTVYPTKA